MNRNPIRRKICPELVHYSKKRAELYDNLLVPSCRRTSSVACSKPAPRARSALCRLATGYGMSVRGYLPKGILRA